MSFQYRLSELFDRMLRGTDFPEGFRAGVEIRGFRMGRGRQPLSPTQRLDRGKLQRMLHCLIADLEVIDRPDFCENGRARPSNDALAETIAREVVAQLAHTKH